MKARLRFFLAILILMSVMPSSRAQSDKHLSGASYYITLANQVPWNQLTGNYIFTPQSPNVGLCLFVENSNTTSAHSINITAFQTGNPSLSGYSGNSALWAASTISGNISNVPAGNVASEYVNGIGAAQVAIVISGTSTGTGSPDVANVFIVQTSSETCGSALSAQPVVGPTSVSSSYIGLRPVVAGGVDSSVSVRDASLGGASGSQFGWILANSGATGFHSTTLIPTSYPDGGGTSILGVAPFLRSNNTIGYEMQYSVRDFHDVSTAASGNTVVWTPAITRFFHLMCIAVDVTGDAKATAGGDVHIQLQDGTTPIPGFDWFVFIPATAFNQSIDFSSGPVCFANGYSSTTANNSLNVNLSFALTGGLVVVRAWGQESTTTP